MSRTRLERCAPWLYAGLLALGIPWYWPADQHDIVLGLPAWVVVAIVAATLAATLTAVLLARPWPELPDDADD